MKSKYTFENLASKNSMTSNLYNIVPDNVVLQMITRKSITD